MTDLEDDLKRDLAQLRLDMARVEKENMILESRILSAEQALEQSKKLVDMMLAVLQAKGIQV